MNDCHQYDLGPFSAEDAQAMLQHFARAEGWALDPTCAQHLMARVGWLSPYYLCLLLDSSFNAASQRLTTTPKSTAKNIDLTDVDAAYEQLVSLRTGFVHWEKRLVETLATDAPLCIALLSAVTKTQTGLTLPQLHARLAKFEADPDQRAQRLQDLMPLLSDEGYLSTPDAAGRVHFLSFLLRDWWKRNHV